MLWGFLQGYMKLKIACSSIFWYVYQGWLSLEEEVHWLCAQWFDEVSSWFLCKGYVCRKIDCMLCLDVLIDWVRSFIYSFFHMGWWRFRKLCVIINLYFQGSLQGADDGCVLIVKVSLVWGVQRFGRKECWWQEVQFCALILAYGSIVVIQELYTEGVVSKIFYYLNSPRTR